MPRVKRSIFAQNFDKYLLKKRLESKKSQKNMKILEKN